MQDSDSVFVAVQKEVRLFSFFILLLIFFFYIVNYFPVCFCLVNVRSVPVTFPIPLLFPFLKCFCHVIFFSPFVHITFFFFSFVFRYHKHINVILYYISVEYFGRISLLAMLLVT